LPIGDEKDFNNLVQSQEENSNQNEKNKMNHYWKSVLVILFGETLS